MTALASESNSILPNVSSVPMVSDARDVPGRERPTLISTLFGSALGLAFREVSTLLRLSRDGSVTG
jgi:hypothetical protein